MVPGTGLEPDANLNLRDYPSQTGRIIGVLYTQADVYNHIKTESLIFRLLQKMNWLMLPVTAMFVISIGQYNLCYAAGFRTGDAMEAIVND